MYHCEIYQWDKDGRSGMDGLKVIALKMPGTISDERWKELQQVTEERFRERFIPAKLSLKY
jgi:hypothetical protein